MRSQAPKSRRSVHVSNRSVTRAAAVSVTRSAAMCYTFCSCVNRFSDRFSTLHAVCYVSCARSMLLVNVNIPILSFQDVWYGVRTCSTFVPREGYRSMTAAGVYHSASTFCCIVSGIRVTLYYHLLSVAGPVSLPFPTDRSPAALLRCQNITGAT